MNIKNSIAQTIDEISKIDNSEEMALALPKLIDAINKLPAFAPGWHLIGITYIGLEQFENARVYIAKALSIDADNLEYQFDYARSIYHLKRYEEAVSLLEQLINLSPQDARIRFFLASSYSKLEKNDVASQHILLIPDDANLSSDQWYQIACFALYKDFDAHKCESAIREAIRLEPEDARLHNILGWALVKQLHFKNATNAFIKASNLEKSQKIYFSNFLFVSTYYLNLPPDQLLDVHQQYCSKYLPAIVKNKINFKRKSPKKLKIGYISADFRQHVVWNFIEPVLAGHHRDRVSVHCFHQSKKSDSITKRLQSCSDGWTDICHLDTQSVLNSIRENEIDVLVDLSGHTGHNRLDVFANRAAPLQVSYLGYIATTGLQAMDLRITDAVLNPYDSPELYSESLYRLPRCYKAYIPYLDAPDILQRPCKQPVVFGSLHRLEKITESTIELWAKVLSAVPNSKLLIARTELSHRHNLEFVMNRFKNKAIPESQLLFAGNWTGSHLNLYNQIDICLDTMPVTGGATTAEALWMGVPMITKAGSVMRERISASILYGLGMQEWVADSDSEFVNIAVDLAQNTKRRSYLRQHLRSIFRASELGDGASLAESIEDAFFSLLP